MRIVTKFVRYYLLCVDAVIRLLGAYLIIALMFGVLGVLLHSLNWVLFGSFAQGPLHLWVVLVLAPPILRIGVMAGGFSIPPLFKRSSDAAGMNKANKPLQATR